MRINPQAYLPNLNETIRRIESIDGVDHWSVTTLGQIEKRIKIFKGPRLKSENIIVEEPGPTVEPYYTPSAVLQEKGESAKLLDISRATAKQLNVIDAIRVKRGDIVITRSGTIGRVAFITQRLHNAIVSDDLIRIRLHNDDLRYYVYAYLQTDYALHQMLRNEYGAVQQHLEPTHIADILIPVPEDWDSVRNLIDETKEMIMFKEQLEKKTKEIHKGTEMLVSKLISVGSEENEKDI